MRTRFIVIAALSLVLVAALAIGATMAFLTDTKEAENIFTVGKLTLALAEPDYPSPAPSNNAPGDSFPKNPTVTAAKGNGFMRVTVEYIDLDTDARITDAARLAQIWETIYYTPDYESARPGSPALPLDTDGKNAPAQLQKTEAQLSALTAQGMAEKFNTASFAKDMARSEPGLDFYNYSKSGTQLPGADPVDDIFLEGASAVLFNSIVIPSDWGEAEFALLGRYKIVIRAEAIQADNFGSAAAAFTALDTELTKAG
ncbi:MAG: SipW-dependent-type signal peptide-containing protein [Oscillospiraceae bacterium]|nr:SipW-dependent-type signal peptide-containing protein [Oscillospiraceae bacterium]